MTLAYESAWYVVWVLWGDFNDVKHIVDLIGSFDELQWVPRHKKQRI